MVGERDGFDVYDIGLRFLIFKNVFSWDYAISVPRIRAVSE